MVKGEEWFMIKGMYRQGLSIAEISRRTSLGRKTVRRVIKSTGPPSGRKGCSRPSKVDPFKGYLVTRMSQGVFNAEKLMREIRRMGYEGRISILREFVHPFRESQREVATQSASGGRHHRGSRPRWTGPISAAWITTARGGSCPAL